MSPGQTIDLVGTRIKSGQAELCAEQAWLKESIYVAVKTWSGTDAELVQRSSWFCINLTVDGGTALTGARVGGQVHYEGVDRPGSLTFVPAGVDRHSWYSAADLKYVGLFFHPVLAESLECIKPVHDLRPQINSCDRFIETIVARIGEEIESDAKPSAIFMEHAVALIALQLMKLDSQPVTDAFLGRRLNRRVIQQISDYVENHLADDISLAELAAVAQMPTDNFARAFKRSTGMAPYQFVLERRVRRAEHLLSRTAASIASIALATGFASQSHLTTTFRRATGQTPHAYRLSHVS